jgi:NADPH:quinone reductase-like Zn-dependent oxidoreductase
MGPYGSEGAEVASLLLGLGGYSEYAIASSWTPKPPNVSWSDAAGLPSSAEAAVGVLKLLGVSGGETLVILGAAGSVGMIATQLAVAQGLKVIGMVWSIALGSFALVFSEVIAGHRRLASSPSKPTSRP